MKKMLVFILLTLTICSCSTTHRIEVSQRDFKIIRMEHLQKENYNFEVPKLEKQGDKYALTANEVDKIIRNNKRFAIIIENKTDEANTKLAYYEDTIKNLGGAFEVENE